MVASKNHASPMPVRTPCSGIAVKSTQPIDSDAEISILLAFDRLWADQPGEGEAPKSANKAAG
jgi:hypothetical protein